MSLIFASTDILWNLFYLNENFYKVFCIDTYIGFFDDEYDDFGGGYGGGSGFGMNRRSMGGMGMGGMRGPQRGGGRMGGSGGNMQRQRGATPGSHYVSRTGHSVHMRGLPFQALESDIAEVTVSKPQKNQKNGFYYIFSHLVYQISVLASFALAAEKNLFFVLINHFLCLDLNCMKLQEILPF